MKRFERSNGLDTALYKNYRYLFFYIVMGCKSKEQIEEKLDSW